MRFPEWIIGPESKISCSRLPRLCFTNIATPMSTSRPLYDRLEPARDEIRVVEIDATQSQIVCRMIKLPPGIRVLASHL
jgi:hypothetical protein